MVDWEIDSELWDFHISHDPGAVDIEQVIIVQACSLNLLPCESHRLQAVVIGFCRGKSRIKLRGICLLDLLLIVRADYRLIFGVDVV